MRRRMATAMESKVKQPHWNRPPSVAARPPLKLYNSLTRSKEEFVPLATNKVTWYSCGPTVYNSSHMGHARNYVTIDINRRLMEDYFGFNVVFVQNVTDVDDKIIVRGRQSYLFNKFASKIRSDGVVSVQARDQAREALLSYVESAFAQLELSPPLDGSSAFTKWLEGQNKEELTVRDPKFPMNAAAVLEGLHSLEADDVETFIKNVENVLVRALDNEHGHEVTDPEVFRELSSFYEADFDEDMRQLNVKPATITTRVSEYIPEIVEFVGDIVKRNYAYASDDGSVYFDVNAFQDAPGHDYAKLQPWNKGVQELIDDGEGSLSLKASGKRSRSDFALWKASKPGEPSWDSPWGKGRPGWHIECSVMASHVLGPRIDIHTGGIDLAFPHHDNELAQTEARFDETQWVNYFLHTGHLHIEGQKMSKSLKNFITIKEALQKFTARQLRLAFAFQAWNTQLDFKFSLSNVKAFESTLTNYFNTVAALARDATATTSKKVGGAELDLLRSLSNTQVAVDLAFADNLNTPGALQALLSLVQSANEYISSTSGSGSEPKVEVLKDVARWVTEILRILGFEVSTDFGWASNGGTSADAPSKEDTALPFIQILARFRDEVRKIAIAQEVPDQDLLALSDRVRDVDLLAAGVALDDRRAEQASLVKFLSNAERDEILAQRHAAEYAAEEKARRKAEAQKQRDEQERQKREQAKVKPQEMFLQSSEYSRFDDSGLPTHDAAGEPLSKSAYKKLQKIWAAQDKLYKQYKN